MTDCLMYKLCYHDFGKVMTEHSKPTGYDRVRNVEIARKDVELQHLDEAFTSEHWIVSVARGCLCAGAGVCALGGVRWGVCRRLLLLCTALPC